MNTSVGTPFAQPAGKPTSGLKCSQVLVKAIPVIKRQTTSAIQLNPQKLTDPILCIDELNRRYAVVNLGGKAQVAEDHGSCIEFMSFHDFERFYNNISVHKGKRQVQLGKYWLRHGDRKQFLDGIVFDPDENTSPSQYNLWTGYTVDAVSNKCCDLILDHLLNVICDGNQQHCGYLLDWLALLAQQPGQLPLVAIVLLSGQGTGKGLLMDYLGKIFGRHYKHIINKSHLTGNFSGHLQDAVLVFADELSWDGNKADTGIMKGLITEPTRMMEKKFADAVTVKNCTHLIVASNATWAVPAEISDRRYFVLDVSSRMKGDHIYFDGLAAEMNGGGPSGLLAFLLQRDISTFKASKFPVTQAKINQQLMSLEPVETWLVEQLQLGYIYTSGETGLEKWPTRLDKRTVYNAFCSWFTRHQLKHAVPGLGAFTSSLKKYGIETYRMSEGNRHYGYMFPPLEAIQGHFEGILGGNIGMDNNDAD
jgi:hypothetical protein